MKKLLFLFSFLTLFTACEPKPIITKGVVQSQFENGNKFLYRFQYRVKDSAGVVHTYFTNEYFLSGDTIKFKESN
ncbi:MAG: hypothetical protein WC428_02390 [Candidatus Paceibacterota bacterium]|jgi:hypothetical protein